jgi:Protein of unknown function (DUF3089)
MTASTYVGRRVAVSTLMAGLFVTVAALAFASAAHARTVWLCFPGHSPDPCTPGLSTTVFTPTLKKVRVEHPRPVNPPKIDCFYVYPTVSGQPTGNANLHIDPVERSIALYQAARYSQYCRVFAPMYRQLTLAGIGQGNPTTKPNSALALADVRGAFRTYLQKYNHGRGFVLIGHSQGSFELEKLIAKDVDPKPAVRRKLVSAILMGGNVLVKKGSDVGGDFKHIPACRSATQLGCVIAFSTFDQPVPTPTLFGRPGAIPGQPAGNGEAVLCTNPAALAGGSGLLDPINPSKPFDPHSVLSTAIKLLGITQPEPHTVWSSEPGAFSARCSSANDANVLEIAPRGGDTAPRPSPTPEWGLHLLDANIALGNLIGIVTREAGAFVRSGR